MGLIDTAPPFFCGYFFYISLWPFQEYFYYFELIIKQRLAKTGAPREKAHDLP